MGYYFMIYFKRLLNYFKCDPDWPKVQVFMNSCKEVSNQIDVTYIVLKLMFLDAAIAQLMEKQDLAALYLREKPTFDKVNRQRRMHFASELTKQNMKLEREKDGDGDGDS